MSDTSRELISIREAGRRIGVSDTAVRKAIDSGRVKVAGHTKGGRPQLAWPDVKDDWLKNSDNGRRTHVGTQGGVNRTPDAVPAIVLPTIGDTPTAAGDEVDSNHTPGLNESKAKKEKYLAEIARLEYEAKSGTLVEVSKVKEAAFKLARTVRDGLLNIPDRVSAELAHETDAAKLHARLTAEIRLVLEALAE
jgi:hypothetical protein